MTTVEKRSAPTDESENKLREVPISWESLEDAFENNAHEVHSYLHLETGEVIRVVDGVADPTMHSRIMSDPLYLRVDPVSSREQYRWMEHFIAEVEDDELKQMLLAAIDGKGAFRRFKDVLIAYPVDRERWFTFRSARLRECMEGWLLAHDIKTVERPEWKVPSAEEVKSQVENGAAVEVQARKKRASTTDAARARLRELVELLAARDVDSALAFLEFLRDRRRAARASTDDAPSGD
jgi:hypothetical protein